MVITEGPRPLYLLNVETASLFASFDNLIFQNNLCNTSKTVTVKSDDSIFAFCIDRIVVLCSSWKSCPETSAEVLCKTLFQCFQDVLQLTVTAQL